MGLHTWFRKDKEIYNRLEKLYEKLDQYDNGEIYLDDLELLQINSQVDKLYEENKTDYHDLFRTSKRNADNTYTDDVIYSKKECDLWLEENKDLVYWSDKLKSLELLQRFWEEYPDGVIDFG